jgi:hypothetical protein
MQRSVIAASIFVSASIASAEFPDTSTNDYEEFDDTDVTLTDVIVEGTLRIKHPGVFAPQTLSVGLDGAGNGTLNTSAPDGEWNGDVYFDGGTANIGTINAGQGTRLFVNDTVTGDSLTTGGEVIVSAATLTVSGAMTTSNRISVASGGTVDTGSFEFGSSDSLIEGTGLISAGSFALGMMGSIKPGGDAVGAITLQSPTAVDLTDVIMQIDLSDPSLDIDHLIVDGDVTGSLFVFPIGFQTLAATPAELAANGPFVFLTADSISDLPINLDPSLIEIRDENDVLLGNMVLGMTATTAYFTYHPVPEPAAMGLLSIGVLAMGRRRAAGE